jgi:hypothetical protein
MSTSASACCSSWARADAAALYRSGRRPPASSTVTYGRAKHPHAPLPDLWITMHGAMSEATLSQLLEARAERVGIGDVHPHMFRHSFAHNWLTQGGNEGDLMRLAGWPPRMARLPWRRQRVRFPRTARQRNATTRASRGRERRQGGTARNVGRRHHPKHTDPLLSARFRVVVRFPVRRHLLPCDELPMFTLASPQRTLPEDSRRRTTRPVHPASSDPQRPMGRRA